MYTCSHPNEIQEYLEFFEKNNIRFKYVNENPEVPDAAYGYYQDKFYFNVLFEDKAGFETAEWQDVKDYIEEFYDFDKSEFIVEEDSHENFFGYNIRRVWRQLKKKPFKLRI